MRAVLLIARKELWQRLRNRTFFVIGIVAPLALALIFNLVLGGVLAGNVGSSFAFGLASADSGPVATGFGGMLDSLDADGVIDLTRLDSADAARAAIDGGDLSAAFILPAGFSAAAILGNPAAIEVLADVDADISGAVAAAIAERFAIGVRTASLAARTALQTGAIGALQMGAATEAAARVDPPARLATVAVASRQLPQATFFVAGMGVFFMFFIAGTATSSLLEERQNGTLARLLAAPVPPAAIVAGKTIAGIGLCLLAMAVLAVASSLLMGADWGHPAYAFLVIAGAVVAGSGLMTLVGSLARTTAQAQTLQSVVAMVSALIGGSFVPIRETGTALASARYLTPNAWFVSGLGDVVGGAYREALVAAAVLFAIGVVSGGIGLALVRRLLKP